jgi:hypothetical protein
MGSQHDLRGRMQHSNMQQNHQRVNDMSIEIGVPLLVLTTGATGRSLPVLTKGRS